MKWASTASTKATLDDAIEEVVGRVGRELPEGIALAVVFVSPHHAPRYDEVAATLRSRLRPRVLIGCSAGGVIGGGREIEEAPGLSLTAAVLPGVDLAPFRASAVDEPLASDPLPQACAASARVVAARRPVHVRRREVSPRPRRTMRARRQDRRFGERRATPGGERPVPRRKGPSRRARRRHVVRRRARRHPRGARLSADRRADVRHPVDREPDLRARRSGPLEVLQQLHEGLGPRDRELFRHSLFVGLVMRERARSTAGAIF